MKVQTDIQSFSIEDIVRLYPQLYSHKKLDEWRCLFSDRATVVRSEAGCPVVCCSIDESLRRQRSYVVGCGRIDEKWDSVEVKQFGSIATIKANYRLTTVFEIREGVDLLTLVRIQNGWKIFCLAYEQTLYIKKQSLSA